LFDFCSLNLISWSLHADQISSNLSPPHKTFSRSDLWLIGLSGLFHPSGGYLPASDPLGTGSIPSDSMWVLRWKIWLWDMLCFSYFDLPMPGYSITALYPFIHLSPTHYLNKWQRCEITHVNKPIQSFQFRILPVAIINKESEIQSHVFRCSANELQDRTVANSRNVKRTKHELIFLNARFATKVNHILNKSTAISYS
jgi:hypothetical protein